MPKFIVEVREVHVSFCEIEADDRESAVQLVHEGEGEYVGLEYSDTLGKETWAVCEEDKPTQTYYYNESTGKYDKTIGDIVWGKDESVG